MDNYGNEKSNRLILAAAAVIAGVVLAFFVAGTVKNRINEKNETRKKTAELEKTLSSLRAKETGLSEEISELNNRYDTLLSSVAAESENNMILTKRLISRNRRLEFLSGVSDVGGKGIRITLDDGDVTQPGATSAYVVHDLTMMKLVEGLREAGAQAISVNEERITASSAFVCVGPSINVNGRKLFAPYTIKAIGPDTLAEDFQKTKAYANLVNSPLRFEVSERVDLIISGYVE